MVWHWWTEVLQVSKTSSRCNLLERSNMPNATVASSVPQNTTSNYHAVMTCTPSLQPAGSSYAAFTPQSTQAQSWLPFLGQVARPVRVLLVDDDANIRHVISSELMADLRCNLVGQGCSVREGRRLISSCELDVMLVDLNLGDGNGFELIEHLKTVRPLAEAIVISAMEDEQHALHAFELGATGYPVKNSWFGNFSKAVLQVVNGGASITPNLARRLLRRLDKNSSRASAPPEPPKKGLSEREHAAL